MFLIQGYFWKVIGAFRTKVSFDGFVENKPEEVDGHVVVDDIPFPKEQITLLTEVQISGVKPLDLCKLMGVAVRTPVKEIVKGTLFDEEFKEMRKRINAVITAERGAKRIIDRDSMMQRVDEIIDFGRAVIASDTKSGNYSTARITADGTMAKLNAILVEVYDAPTKSQALQGYTSYSEAMMAKGYSYN